MTRRIPFPWGVTAVAVLLGAAVATVLFTTVIVFTLHVPLPVRDEWYSVSDFRSYAAGTYGWTDLARQHNEHRLLFPRLFFFADYLLFHWLGTSELAITVLLQGANAAIFICLMRQLVPGPMHRWLLTGFILLLLFTLRQEQNFSNGFQLQFVGVFTAATLAAMAYAAALVRLSDGRGRSWLPFGLAALACFTSAYTMANGVLAGVVLAIAALLRRTPRWVAGVTLALSAALAWAFFRGYVPGGSSLPMRFAATDPLLYLHFLTGYLGSALGTDVRITQTFGTLGLLGTAAAAWRLWTRPEREPASLVLLTVMGFVVASAVATTFGRIAGGSGQAFESRYATPSEMFWIALVLFWFPVATRPWAPRLGTASLAVLMAVLSVAAAYFEAAAWPAMAAQATAFHQVSDSILSGLYDSVAAGYENVTPDEIRLFVPFLRDHRLSLFATPAALYPGRQLADLGPVAAPETCSGVITAKPDASLGAAGVRLSGEAWDRAKHEAIRRIVVVDGSGTVVGLGSASLPGGPPPDWTGYAKAGTGQQLYAYAQLGGGAFCKLGRTKVASCLSEDNCRDEGAGLCGRLGEHDARDPGDYLHGRSPTETLRPASESGGHVRPAHAGRRLCTALYPISLMFSKRSQTFLLTSTANLGFHAGNRKS